MKIINTLLLSIWFVLGLQAQVTIQIDKVPSNTPTDDALYIAGNFNNWNAKDNNYQLLKSGNVYSITVNSSLVKGEYKITRGSWASVEASAKGDYIPNRTINFTVPTTINIQIEGWEDFKIGGGGNSTALPNVKVISNSFLMPQLNAYRKVWIYLPNDYTTNTSKTYPVIYMHDGQNCFDKLTSFAGEWGVDETLSAKQNNGDFGCIVVAIDNGGSSRINEYSPFVNKQYGGGKGNQYLAFIVNTLKPFVDSAYRTKSDKANTGIMGSSMGGIITTYAALKYPNTFGKMGVFSPAYWFTDSLFAYALEQAKSEGQKFYFVCGQNEAGNMVFWQDSMNRLLQKKGYTNNVALKNIIKPNGSHSESFWNAEFGNCYDWLFNSNTNIKDIQVQANDIQVYPNPSQKEFKVIANNASIKHISLYNAEGKQLHKVDILKTDAQNYTIRCHEVKSGTYFIHIHTNMGRVIKKLSLNLE
jgi:predicted alpha/beta superfamily hydrolase